MRRQVEKFSDAILVSAHDGGGLRELLTLISDRLPDRRVRIRVRIPYAEQQLRSSLHETGYVLFESFESDWVVLEALVDASMAERVQPFVMDAAEG